MVAQGISPYAFNPYTGYADMSNFYGSDLMAGNYFGGAVPFCGGYEQQQQYYDQMTNNLNFTSGYQMNVLDNQRDYDMHLNAKGERITNAVAFLNEKVVTSEQEQIVEAYDNLKEAVRAMYPNASEEDIDARAKTYYAQLTGNPLTADIRANGSNSFWQGFKQSLGLGIFADRKTAEENIAEITGSEVSRSQQRAKRLGNTLGGATAGAAIGAGIGSIIPGIGTAIGAGIGAAAGAVGGFFKGLFS